MIKLVGISESMNQIRQQVDAIEQAIVAILQRRGEQFVTECRAENTYKDQTGNLRASIGYFIYKGNIVLFEDGNTNAKSVTDEVTKEEGHYYLIGVAGMNYAAAVEAKGYNVISNQCIQIIPLIDGDLISLKNKLL